MPPDLIHEAPLRDQRGFSMKLAFRKRSAAECVSRIDPRSEWPKGHYRRSGISDSIVLVRLNRQCQIKFCRDYCIHLKASTMMNKVF